MLMFASVACEPPLGQSTVLPGDAENVKFIVLIESSISFSNQPWQAVIWHSGHAEGRWDALNLTEGDALGHTLAVSSRGRPSVYRRYFTGFIPRPSASESQTIKFTLKYRTTESDWKWVNDHTALTDGQIHFQPLQLPHALENYIESPDPSIQVESPSSEVPNTKLWTISAPVGKSGEESAYSRTLLGVPSRLIGWFALVRIWAAWLAPEHGKSPFSISRPVLLVSFLRDDGLHFVLLAVSGVHNTLTLLEHDHQGGVIIKARNDGIEAAKATVVAASGYSFEAAAAACVNQARKIATGGFEIDGPLAEELETTSTGEKRLKRLRSPDSDPPKTMWRSTWLDGLTYCTWNSLGQKLTEQKILNALADLDKHNIKITNLIIDDGWQSLDNPGAPQQQRGWTRFDAHKEGFPNGLKHCVYEARDRHPNIEHVAVWHALIGYWGGISPGGSIAKEYKTQNVRKEHNGVVDDRNVTMIAAEDVERFYDDFYGFLQGCRVDSIKTDAQFFLDVIHDPQDRRNLIQKYQDTWTVSSLKWFSTKSISCMSQAPQVIFHSQLPQNRPRICVRNSDDFFPEIPSSHTWHLFANAYTSLFTHHLNAIPDWDMFQTYHDYSSFHAAARCVSGGPVYITDEPGKHDLNVIAQMTAQNNRDDTIILRPSTIGRVTHSGVYTAYQEERLLKVSTFHGRKGTGAGILGVFNVSARALTELVMLRDFPGMETERSYVVRAHTTGEVSPPLRLMGELPLVSLFLDVKGWEILTAYPLITCAGETVAPLGLLSKMTGVAAIVNTDIERDASGRLRISVQLKALGDYGVYIKDLPQKSIEEDMIATINGRPIPMHTVSTSGSVFAIDLAQAWKETNLQPTWNNEVSVVILIGRLND